MIEVNWGSDHTLAITVVEKKKKEKILCWSHVVSILRQIFGDKDSRLQLAVKYLEELIIPVHCFYKENSAASWGVRL